MGIQLGMGHSCQIIFPTLPDTMNRVSTLLPTHPTLPTLPCPSCSQIKIKIELCLSQKVKILMDMTLNVASSINCLYSSQTRTAIT
ncbi:MAG: hypothetical protein C6Y22_04180 [Hapalosiphonaceae cyanobacterium JJU2]|nr:MAG: hypothetical protein C6Y22_04180 [Hapalosiphonaceae cyanobacterium JJU2]